MTRPHASRQQTATHCEACGRRPASRIRTRDAAGLFTCPDCRCDSRLLDEVALRAELDRRHPTATVVDEVARTAALEQALRRLSDDDVRRLAKEAL